MSFKEKLYNFGLYALGSIFIFGVACIFIAHEAKGDIGFWLFTGTGWVIVTPFIIYYGIKYFNAKKEQVKEHRRFQANILDFKTNAVKVPVDLNAAKIQSHSWTEIIPKTRGRYDALNELNEDWQPKDDTITHYKNTVTFKIPYRKKRITIKETIFMEPTALRMHFYTQEYTVLYVDPKNSKNYLLDLDFLND